MMARAVTLDLTRQDDVEEVRVVDSAPAHLHDLRSRLRSPKIRASRFDVRDPARLRRLLKPCAAAISCVPYMYNLELTRAAIGSGVHFCDLGGNNDIVGSQLLLDRQAKAARVAVVPDCGLAPGLVSILAADGYSRLDRTESIHIRVGGLPRKPRPPLDYAIVFSAHGLINEYSEPCVVLRNGRITEVPPMTGLERVRFATPFDRLEAFSTSGGSSTLPRTFRGKVRTLDYKTIRYPGHCGKMKLLLDLGFGSNERRGAGASATSPRELLVGLLEDRLGFENDDVILMRVDVSGIRSRQRRRVRYQCIDFADRRRGLTAMMRMTGFPAAVVALMLARGQVRPGAHTGEAAVSTRICIDELRKRGIPLTIETRALRG